jgi:hypothetical protein
MSMFSFTVKGTPCRGPTGGQPVVGQSRGGAGLVRKDPDYSVQSRVYGLDPS